MASEDDHILEDASALLQFSKASATPVTDHNNQHHHPPPPPPPPPSLPPLQVKPGIASKPIQMTTTEKPSLPSPIPPSSVSPSLKPTAMSPSSNPGPAVAALSVSKDSKKEHTMKAIVAAAALAAAASTPLPLHSGFMNSEPNKVPPPTSVNQQKPVPSILSQIPSQKIVELEQKQPKPELENKPVMPPQPQISTLDSTKSEEKSENHQQQQISLSENQEETVRQKIEETVEETKQNMETERKLDQETAEKEQILKHSDKEKGEAKDDKKRKQKQKQKQKQEDEVQNNELGDQEKSITHPTPTKSKSSPKTKDKEKLHIKQKPKKKETVPSYAVDPDAGIIDCICKVNEDDGFTIQCDRCFRWQHALCFNINTNDVPDIYYCELCDSKSFKAKSIDVKKMREIQLVNLGSSPATTRPSSAYVDSVSKRRYESDSSNTADRSDEPKRKKKLTNKDRRFSTEHNSKESSDDKQDRTTNDRDSQRKEKTSRKRKKEDFDDNTNEELITRIESAKDEYYYAVYYNLKDLEYKNKEIENYCANNLPQLLLNAEKHYARNRKYKMNLKKLSIEEYNKLRSGKSTTYAKNILIGENNSVPSSHYKFSGLSNLGVFSRNNCEKGELIDEFLGEVDYQVNFFNNPINQYKHWGVPKNYYFFVNYFGRYENNNSVKEEDKEEENDNSDESDGQDVENSIYNKDNLSNLAVGLENYLQAKATAGDPSEILAPLYLNCKTSGSVSRFVRKSCNPNCQIIPVIVNNSMVKFYLQAIKPVNKNSELTVGWEFDFNKLFAKLYCKEHVDIDKYSDVVKSNFNNILTNAEKVQLINQVEFVLGQYKCGCYSVSNNVNNNKCKLLKIKKMGSYFFRSSRKGSRLSKDAKNGDGDSNTRSLIKSRLIHRDEVIADQIKKHSINLPDQIDNNSREDPQNVVEEEKASKDLNDPFTHARRKEIFEHPKKKLLLTRTLDYAVLNSRAQLAKAIIANCLSIPVPVKTTSIKIDLVGVTATSLDLHLLEKTMNLKNVGAHEKKNDVLQAANSEAKKKEKHMNESKKVKKMSFADFLKHKAG